MQNNTELLPDFWYVAAPASQLKRSGMLPVKLLGTELLLLRDKTGAVSALRDFCPHRGIPLRHGRFDGTEVECCYHGWRFDMSGTCTLIPSLTQDQTMDVRKINCGSYPCHEKDGLIWVYGQAGATPTAPPPFDMASILTAQGVVPLPLRERPGEGALKSNAQLDQPSPARGEGSPATTFSHTNSVPRFTHVTSVTMPCPIDHAVIGLMDPAHGPFVHQAWWWRSGKSIHTKQKQFAPRPFGFAMVSHKPSTNSRAYKILGGDRTTEIQFQLPALRSEHITIGNNHVLLLTALTPVDEQTTILHQFAYTNMGLLRALFPLLKIFGRRFIGQDLDIVVKQQEGLRGNTTPLMLIADADTQALWYYRLKKEALAAAAENRAFENPLKERVLKWRS